LAETSPAQRQRRLLVMMHPPIACEHSTLAQASYHHHYCSKRTAQCAGRDMASSGKLCAGGQHCILPGYHRPTGPHTGYSPNHTRATAGGSSRRNRRSPVFPETRGTADQLVRQGKFRSWLRSRDRAKQNRIERGQKSQQEQTRRSSHARTN
jgi:hypothetical protein